MKSKESMKKMLKQVICTLIVTALIMNLTACSKSTDKAKSDVDIVVGFNTGSLCLAPLHIALANGYFNDEFEAAGVSWKYEKIDISSMSELMEAKKIDASVNLSGSMMQQMDNGLEIIFTGGLHTGCTKFYVKSDSKVKFLNDLKGKKIGVPSLTDSGTMVLKRKLNDLGIGVSTDNMEVEFVVYGLTDLPLALNNGAIDLAILHDPIGYQAEEEYGFIPILDTALDEKFSKEYCCQICIYHTLVEQNPKAVAAYTRALLKAAAFIQAQPKEAAKIQIDNNYCSGDLETNSKLLASYNFSPSVNGGYTTFQSAAIELQEIGELKQDQDIEKFIEKHFTKLDGVPESYIYEPKDGTFKEINK